MGTDEGFTSGAFIKMLRRVSSDNSISAVFCALIHPAGMRWRPTKCCVKYGFSAKRNRR